MYHEINKHYKSGFFPFLFRELVVKHLPARHSLFKMLWICWMVLESMATTSGSSLNENCEMLQLVSPQHNGQGRKACFVTYILLGSRQSSLILLNYLSNGDKRDGNVLSIKENKICRVSTVTKYDPNNPRFKKSYHLSDPYRAWKKQTSN